MPFPGPVACRGARSLLVCGPRTFRWTAHMAWALPGKCHSHRQATATIPDLWPADTASGSNWLAKRSNSPGLPPTRGLFCSPATTGLRTATG